MINIVKYPKTIYTRHRFQCPDCECIFDADASDYSYTIMPIGYDEHKEFIYIKCPICNKIIVNELKDIKTIMAVPNYTRENISLHIK